MLNSVDNFLKICWEGTLTTKELELTDTIYYIIWINKNYVVSLFVKYFVPCRFPCMHCDYKATTASHLKKHKESVHEGIKYKCNECDHESTTKESLKVHKRSLHKKILFPCLKCDYVAKVNSHLKQHVRSVHDKVRFPCDNCEYTAINNSRLKHHKETMHSGLKFTCDNHAVQECMIVTTKFWTKSR